MPRPGWERPTPRPWSVSMRPGPLPTTSAVVFFETLPGDFPPRALMASAAPSRLNPVNVPLTTTDAPSSVRSTSTGAGPSIVTPAARSFSIEHPVGLVVEPGPDRRRDGGADAVDGGQLVLGGGRDPVHVTEVCRRAVRPRLFRDGGCSALAAGWPACGSSTARWRPAGSPPTSRRTSRSRAAAGVERVDVGHVRRPDRAQRTDATRCSPNPSMSMAEREAKCSMAPADDRRARGIHASMLDLTLGSNQRFAAHRARGRELPRGKPVGPLGQHGAEHLGDDVTRLANDDGVAGPDVLQSHLILVVQRGHLDRAPADEDRLQHGEGRRPPGTPHRDLDVACSSVVFSSGGNL